MAFCLLPLFGLSSTPMEVLYILNSLNVDRSLLGLATTILHQMQNECRTNPYGHRTALRKHEQKNIFFSFDAYILTRCNKSNQKNLQAHLSQI